MLFPSFFLHLTDFQMLVRQANKKIFWNSFLKPYDGDSSDNNDGSEDNTSEDEVEEHGFYQYSGMEAIMETGRYIYFF